MIGELKTVKLKQGIDCDTGKHLIPQGGQFLTLPSGRLSCPKHKDDEPMLETNLAGSLR